LLDCQTPRGRRFIDEQHKTQCILESMGYTFINMATDDAFSDAIIARKKEDRLIIAGVCEIKTRVFANDTHLTVKYLKANGGYLITYDKISHGVETSSMLSVPFFLIVRLVHENVILIWKISDDQGVFEFDFEKRVTTTKGTCNGGTAKRLNAYLPVEKSTIIRVSEG
jgi:hypothetical protein